MDPPNPNPNLLALIDPQNYERTRQMIQNARIYMDQMEAQNETGFQAFSYTEQELQRRIREGREAEMLAAQLRAGNVPQQPFIAQQPQATTWQHAPMPLPSVQQHGYPTSARIEEVPSLASGRASRSGSHSTFQRNDSSSNHRNQHSPQSESPQNTNFSYGQSVNYGSVPVQTTTFIPHDLHGGQPSRWQNYHAPPPAVPIHSAPLHQPPPPPVYQPIHQQAPSHPTTSTSSSASSHPVPVHNVSEPQPSTGQRQTTASYDLVKHILGTLQKHKEEVQTRAIAQILDYINGKPTPNHQIRAWGDALKQVGGPDPKALLNAVLTGLAEQRKARQAARSRTHDAQPQPQAEPVSQSWEIPQYQPAPQSQFQPAQPDQPPQLPKISVATNLADDAPHSPPSEEVLRNLLTAYARELSEAKIDLRRAADIISVAYVSARLKEPPKTPDVWVRRTLEIFSKHFSIDRLPSIFENLLRQLKRPIPNIPALTEPRTAGHPSSSLSGALAEPASNVTSSTARQDSSVGAQPPEDDVVMQSGASDTLPQVQMTQSRDLAPAGVSWTQATGTASYVSTQPSSSSNIIPANPPYSTTTNPHTTTVPSSAPRRAYQPVSYNQLALAPRYYVSSVVPNQIQGKVHQPQPSVWMPYYQPEASTSALPERPPVKVRLPREADRSRLAKDFLKQLGKPSGSAPAVPTSYEHEERKKAEAEMEATPVQPATEPAVTEPPLLPNHGDPPLPLEILSIPDQVASSDLHMSHPPATPTSEPPLLEYPDPDPQTTSHDIDATEQDVDMDTQPHEDSLVPQPPTSPSSNLPQDSAPSPVVHESAPDMEEMSAVDRAPTSIPPSSPRRSGPPPDAEIIEISDDEEPAAQVATPTIGPMEVDGGMGAGGAISQSFSELSLDEDNILVAVETKDRTEEQEPISPEDIESTLQREQPFVELPPLPDYARQKGKERAPVHEEDEEDPELQAVVDLTFSRLRPTRCLWLGCKATLNSVDNLVRHLKIHADETERTSDNLECQWKKCTRSYRTRVKLDRHCAHHAQKVLHCPYEDCGEEFRDAGELLDHAKDMHENSDLLPSTNPVPHPGQALDALPEQVPSWSIFPASVAPVPISVDRHGQIGRWVARNISGTSKRPDPSKRLRSSRRFDTGKQKSMVSEIEDMVNEERFGFLSSTDDGNTGFADIPSEAVSLYCRHGMLKLCDNNDRLSVAQDTRRERSEFGGIDGGDGVARTDAPAEEDVISLGLEPRSSEDELLLKPANT